MYSSLKLLDIIWLAMASQFETTNMYGCIDAIVSLANCPTIYIQIKLCTKFIMIQKKAIENYLIKLESMNN